MCGGLLCVCAVRIPPGLKGALERLPLSRKHEWGTTALTVLVLVLVHGVHARDQVAEVTHMESTRMRTRTGTRLYCRRIKLRSMHLVHIVCMRTPVVRMIIF